MEGYRLINVYFCSDIMYPVNLVSTLFFVLFKNCFHPVRLQQLQWCVKCLSYVVAVAACLVPVRQNSSAPTLEGANWCVCHHNCNLGAIFPVVGQA